MNYPIEIRFKKWRMYLLLLAGLGFVVSSAWFISLPEIDSPLPAWAIAAVGWVGLLFFGVCTFYIIRMIRRNLPALEINTSGLYDRTTGSSVGRIDWEDIEGFRPDSLLGNHFILVEVSNPEEYIRRGEGVLAQKALKSNHKMYNTPVVIGTDNLTMKHGKLLALLEGELATYRALPEELRMELREALPRELRR